MLVYSLDTIVILLLMYIIQIYYNNTKIEICKKHVT